MLKQILSFFLQGLWLLACAVPAALIAHSGVSALGLDGVAGTLVIVFVAMVLALAFFSLTVVLGRALRFIR